MNTKMMGLLFLGFFVGSMAAPLIANAQETTLDYQGTIMSGTSTSIPPGYLYPAPLPTSPFSGTLSGFITVDGSVSANDLTLVSFGFTMTGTNGINLTWNGGGSSGFIFSTFNGPGGTIELTTSNGAITGATVGVNDTEYHAPATQIGIGPSGDSFSYYYNSDLGDCQAQIPMNGPPGGPYPPAPVINPCTVNISNTTAGAWTVTQAPEIDPASTASGFALLFGSLIVLRSRRVDRLRTANEQ